MHHRRRQSSACQFLIVLFLCSLTMSLCLAHFSSKTWQLRLGEVAIAQSPHASQIVQQGVESYQLGDFQAAIESWQTALRAYQNTDNLASEAIVLENLARAYQQIGQIERAISYWEQVIDNYQQQGDMQQVGRMLTQQAQAYTRLGQPRKAIALLCGEFQQQPDQKAVCLEGTALQIARTQKDQTGEVSVLGSLGEAYRLRGDYDQAITYLEDAKQIENQDYLFSLLNSLGNAHFSRAQLNENRANSAKGRNATDKATEFQFKATKDYNQALNNFNNSLQLSRTQNHKSGQLRVLLNLIRLNYQLQKSTLTDDVRKTDEYVQQALNLLQELPDSQHKIHGAINLAKLEEALPTVSSTALNAKCRNRKLKAQAQELLTAAVSIAKHLQDSRSESFALGELGHLYECRRDYNQALEITQQARLSAEQNWLAKDSLYLWEWQAGRIFKAQGKELEAVAAYERAINTLKDIRGELLSADRDLQFDFRDAINPLYREFAQLRLERANLLDTTSEQYEQELNSALETIDALKLAELQNYLGDDCVLRLINEERVDELVRGDTAVFSSIILEDKPAIVLSIPDGRKKLKQFKWIEIDSKTLTEEIDQFRTQIQEFYDPTQAFLIPAQNLYDLLIRPFTPYLNSAQIKTLVFIQDGILRSVPMAALHDGEKFLVEKYAVATTPSLTLTDPQTLNYQQLRVLALGLSQQATVDGETFGELENVGNEVIQVKTQFSGSKTLLNDQFTRKNLQQELQQNVYPIIHIATHGKFGTIPEDTFLVTGNNEKITLTELENDILRFSRVSEPVELLALTACQTAVGDDRTTLGLAGITVQAGVKSALASLWSIPDASTQELVIKFYDNLQSGISKAEALKEAQKALIEKGYHPRNWAAFILIGNWL